MKDEESVCSSSSNIMKDSCKELNESESNNEHITLSDQKGYDFDDENNTSISRNRTKLNKIVDSDSDTDKENTHKEVSLRSPPIYTSDDNTNDGNLFNKKRSRIKNIVNSDSESLSGNDTTKAANKYDLTRSKKRNKTLRDKFKKLKNKSKYIATENIVESHSEFGVEKPSEASECSDGEYSCLEIKKKLQKKTMKSLSSICDPDTSDEESNVNIKFGKSKPRSTKLTSPKAVRMSAKQAMENMQKIKSESNRMLREMEVSLPYHRPKALNLKDIMSRRRPAVTSDGKSLPLKMNNEQLKEYALILEQRQKEVMELCKSDTEEEEEENHKETPSENLINTSENTEKSCDNTKVNKENSFSASDINDKVYDDIHMEQKINDKINYVDEHIIEETIILNELRVQNDTEEAHGEDIEPISESVIDKDETDIKEMEDEPLMNNLYKENEKESQNISLHYNTERSEDMVVEEENEINEDINVNNVIEGSDSEKQIAKLCDEFSDNDFSLEDIDKIIDNATDKDKCSSNIEANLKLKPKLTGAPGMVIDLNDDCSSTQRKLSGLELLKERYTYFAKLKSLEETENDREKKFKPGTQHLKLKQALEEQIAEQRSLEWEKRLEEENKLKNKTNTVEVDEEFDGENIEKLEAKLDENDTVDDVEESSSEEEIVEDVNICDKPRKRNPMIDDEAEVSEEENADHEDEHPNTVDESKNNTGESDNDSEEVDDSSESEEDEEQRPSKKGRILKAFEDSDDEDSKVDQIHTEVSESKEFRESQDDEIQLAQFQKSYSEEIITSQECSQSSLTDKHKDGNASIDLGTQTFSILKSGIENINPENDITSEKLDVICETQPYNNHNFEDIVGMCSGSLSQNLVPPRVPTSQLSQSQAFGDDVLALCTGKFYDNNLISQIEPENNSLGEDNLDDSLNLSNSEDQINELVNMSTPKMDVPHDNNITEKTDGNSANAIEGETNLLKSILDELNDPEFDSPKPNKYFLSGNQNQGVENALFKKKFVIESDDENNAITEEPGKKKKRKKRRLEDRALQISDDEEEFSDQDEEKYESDIEEDNNRLVEYDSEENEVEVQEKLPKKRRLGTDFFEQEAELTSEDEWVGSGDEDEAGLDRMEREAGDDEVFHQGKLQQELGEIHMREVLDQDKREVRLLQELLFEDGDLGDGHRQRKFRWKNVDGDEEMGTKTDEYTDTQEEEFESEEQWRKQRHEREMFLKKLKEKDEEDTDINISSSIIKENIFSMTATSVVEKSKLHDNEKKTSNDIPSPKKPFTIFQQNYHNSLLARGRGALARLAALATPLAGDGEEAPKVNASSNRGNFVFAALTPDEAEPKVMKRKAEANTNTPRLIKKMKTQGSNNYTKSLLDHL